MKDAVAVLFLMLGASLLPVAADPVAPVLVSPASNALNVTTSPTLQVAVPDPNSGTLTVRFYGRLALKPGPDFMVAALPDSQNYSSGLNGGTVALFTAQTSWIAANRAASNFGYVAHLGDIVNYGDNNGPWYWNELSDWRDATNALYRLENPTTTGLPNGIPYGAAVGNHEQSPNGDPDGTTTYYNQFFGVSHFTGRPYYGGHYGSNNDNHFDLFSASGLDFIAIYMEYDLAANPLVLDWANNLLHTYSNRQAIVVSHYIGRATTPSTFSDQGAAIYTALRTNANLFLMLSGHVAGEGSRADVFNGHTVQTLVSDYQYYDNGGNGFMRLMQFSPSNSVIRVKTYSPWLDQFETDANSQFTIPYSMSPSVAESDTNFTALGTNFEVVSGTTNGWEWSDLLPNHTYEWYVTVTDSSNHTVTGPTWRFTTRQESAPRGVSAGLLQVSQIPGFSGEDGNTNCQVTLTLGVNNFQVGSFNRGDYNVQAGWSATDDPALGVLISSVAQNGRDNVGYGSNIYSTCAIATNSNGSYRIVSQASTNGAAGDGYEYNVNVAAAWFPYKEYLGGFVRNSPGTNSGDWNLLTGSPGLVLGTHILSLGDGEGVVDLTSLGIDSRTNGILLVNHAKDEGNYATSLANPTNGTWRVYVHDNSVNGTDCEQDPFAFVYIPRTNTAVISGRFLANGTPAIYSGTTPQFTVTNLAAGRWELKVPGYFTTNGVLILSAEGGGTYNGDNIVTYEANTTKDGWIIESRDLPACNLQTPTGDSVASFVFIPAPPAGLTLSETNLVTTEAGGTATFTVRLATQPSANVVVALASGDTSEGTVSPASLTFTPENWDTAQMIVVAGVDDSFNDGDIHYALTCTVSSSDPLYGVVTPVMITVTNIDNEEGLTLPSGTLYYAVGTPAIVLDGRAAVFDPETPVYSGGSLTITLTANGTSDDRLEIRHTGTGAGQIGVSGSTITYGGTAVGTFAGGTGTTPLVVTFNSAMTRPAAEALVRSVTFRNVNSEPSLNPRTVSVALRYGNGFTCSASKSIVVGQLHASDFQEGVDGGYGAYAGAANLELYQVNANVCYPSGHSATGMWVDYPDANNACHLLLRFDNIIGSGLGQIPSNAIVVSAELMLYISDTGDGTPLFRMLRSWNAATDTWNSLGAGIQTNDVEARSLFESQLGSYDGPNTGTGAISTGVMPDVQAWVNGQTNYGWAMVGWTTNANGTAFIPSQSTNLTARPRLRVKWLPAGTALASFRQGVNGYAHAQDTRIRENAPDADASAVTSMYVDAGVTSTTDPEQILLRFDNILGLATNQVPPGARVEVAVLDLASVVGNASGAGGNIHALLQPWQDTNSTWESWLEGIQADGLEAALTPTVMLGNASLTPIVQGGFHSLDVASDVQAWVSGTRTNYGWVGLPWPGGTDGWGMATSESSVERNRPQLRVYYTVVSNPPPAIVLTTPANNASFAAPAIVSLAAAVTTNGNTINYVSFYDATTLLTNIASSPYACSWTFPLVGTNTLWAQAVYGTTNKVNSATNTIAVTSLPPVIVLTLPTNNASFRAPATISLTAVVTSNYHAIEYVGFYHEGTNLIANITTAPYECLWTNVGAGLYDLTARLACNTGLTVDSAVATVTVTNCLPPGIETQPLDQIRGPGGSAFFQVAAANATTYQWRFNGEDISGQTDAVLTLTNIQMADFGTYTVLASGGCGDILSAPARLTLATPPAITSPVYNLGLFSFTFTSQVGPVYWVEYQNNLGEPTWQLLTNVPGTGEFITVTDYVMTNISRFYRVHAQ